LCMVLFERNEESEMMRFKSWWRRLLYTLEVSLANAVAFDGGNFESQFTRSLRSIFIILAFFFNCVFTSLLTTSLLDRQPVLPSIYDIKGATIYYGENEDEATFLSSPQVDVNAIYDATLAPTAASLLSGNLCGDGFVTSVEEAQAFLGNFPGTNFCYEF